MSKKLWVPSPQRVQDANITSYIQYINTEFGESLHDYHDLYIWSIDHIEEFWSSIWTFTNIIHSKGYNRVVSNLNEFPPETKWFIGSKLNFAENLLRYRDDNVALIFKGETRGPEYLTYKELYARVAELAYSLRKYGIQSGDRVVGYMPNIVETIIAMLAATSIGATWSSCGAELGPDAAEDRLGQVSPRIMFTVDAYWYKGKVFDQLQKAKLVADNVPTIEKIIVVPFVSEEFDLSDNQNAENYFDFLPEDFSGEIDFEQVSFSHPLYIMFSSGTTGKPKCMTQSVGGILINHLKELILHHDLKRGDKLLYLSSPSWMMWNWMVSSLAVGSTLVLFEGNPLYPDWKTIWKFIQDEGITTFGCSASYLHYLKNIGATPGQDYDLSELKQISQTGSSLSEEGFEFVYDSIKSDLHFNSISGGTDINGCFAAGSPTIPVYSGQLQSRALGMKVEAYDETGRSVMDTQGELVCLLPSPSMPIYFWGDENNERYSDAYFGFFEDQHVWRHGDYIQIHSDTGGVTFYGRSDSVLKPSGVRIGTAEIYSIVEELSQIHDSLAIGQDWADDQRILLFVQMSEGYDLDDDLKQQISSQLREKASPRHVPALIIETPDIPYTFSGKKVESAITNILHDKPVTNRGAMRNPECLEFYEQIKSQLS